MSLYDRFVDSLHLAPGQTVLIASNLMPLSLLFRKHAQRFDPHLLIDTLQQRIGVTGTLLFPAYNYDFSQGKPYNIVTSPPQHMGALSNAAFKRDDFRRTLHPIFSFLVWGERQADFLELCNVDAFGDDSPYGLLYRLKAIMVMIDVDYKHSFTYAHFVEHQEDAPYRYHKTFTAEYTDGSGQTQTRSCRMFVRDLEQGVQNHYNPLGPIFAQHGVARLHTFFTSQVICIDLYGAYEIIKEAITYAPELLVTFNPPAR